MQRANEPEVASKENYHRICEDELKRHEEINKNTKQEYFICEKELKKKTEEVEMIKIELNVLHKQFSK